MKHEGALSWPWNAKAGGPHLGGALSLSGCLRTPQRGIRCSKRATIVFEIALFRRGTGRRRRLAEPGDLDRGQEACEEGPDSWSMRQGRQGRLRYSSFESWGGCMHMESTGGSEVLERPALSREIVHCGRKLSFTWHCSSVSGDLKGYRALHRAGSLPSRATSRVLLSA